MLSSLSDSSNTNDTLNLALKWNQYDFAKKKMSQKGKWNLKVTEILHLLQTLAMSRLTHHFVNLHDPSNDFLKNLTIIMFFQLLSGRNQSKISYHSVCQLHEDGGLGILNVYSCLSCMKISCLRALVNLV